MTCCNLKPFLWDVPLALALMSLYWLSLVFITVPSLDDGKYCVTGGYDRTVRLWNPARIDPAAASKKKKKHTLPHDGAEPQAPVERIEELPRAFCIQTYDNASYPVSAVAVYRDTNLCIAADKNCWIVDMVTKQTVRKLSGSRFHAGRVNAVDAGSDLYATASYDSTVMLWDAKNRGGAAPIQVLKDAKDSVTAVQIVPDSGTIRSASVDGCVRTYDARYGRLIADQLPSPITGMAGTHDGQFVAASCLDGCIRLLEVEDRPGPSAPAPGQPPAALVNTYEGSHAAGQYGLGCCVLSNDSYVVSGSQDGRAAVYDLVRGDCVQRLAGIHRRSRPVCAVAAHPIRQHQRSAAVVTAGYDGNAIVWCDDGASYFS
jgi:mitogen-activated protein kinase organizer 1